MPEAVLSHQIRTDNVNVGLRANREGWVDLELSLPTDAANRNRASLNCNDIVEKALKYCLDNNIALKVNASAQFVSDDLIALRSDSRTKATSSIAISSPDNVLVEKLFTTGFQHFVRVNSDPERKNGVTPTHLADLNSLLVGLLTPNAPRAMRSTNPDVFQLQAKPPSVQDLVEIGEGKAKLTHANFARGNPALETIPSLFQTLHAEVAACKKSGLPQFALDLSAVRESSTPFIASLIGLHSAAKESGIDLIIRGVQSDSHLSRDLVDKKLFKLFKLEPAA